MIPRVAKLGHGFAGAGLYYLSDKREDVAASDRPTPEEYILADKAGRIGAGELGDRVGFTETRNLPTRDPHKALRCMQWLAAHANDVRLAAAAAAARAAGMAYADYIRSHNPLRGRKGEKPVYTLSIAWHPSKDKVPTKAEMIAAGDEVLKRLGLTDRQCLMVEHRDTAHPHLHLIVNRISPINGKYASVGNDYLKLSAWALDYERRTGHVLCLERMVNWEKRRGVREAKADARKTDPHARGRYIRGKDTPRSDHEWWAAHRHLPDDAVRKARADKQASELKAFETGMGKGLLRLEARLARTLGEDKLRLEAEVGCRRQAHAQRIQGPPRGVAGLMRRLADKLTGRSFREQRQIKAMTRDVGRLDEAMGTARTSARERYAAQWTNLERRHLAERQRDEMRFAARGGKERGDAAIKRARKAFNARGRADTSSLFVARPLPGRLAEAFARIAGSRVARHWQGRTALARIVHDLSGKPIAADRSRQESLARPAAEASRPQPPRTEDAAPAARSERETRTSDARQTGRPGKNEPPATASREDRIAAEMERIEARERQRRKRVRPRNRGRVRRMD